MVTQLEKCIEHHISYNKTPIVHAYDTLNVFIILQGPNHVKVSALQFNNKTNKHNIKVNNNMALLMKW